MEAVELLLSFLAWCGSSTFWDVSNPEGEAEAEFSLKQVMHGLNALVPRSKGQGWNITKVHEIKHIAHDITRFGSPANTYSGPSETHHIRNAKDPAQTVKWERDTFDEAVGKRYTDNLIIDTCHRMFECHHIDPASTPANDEDEDQTLVMSCAMCLIS